ncbi:MAG: hypothetical protein GEV11_04960 [Streptosporangiales bacterium]|nr:hypothetical protein [Streptosporangiales bacterium]
MSKLGVTALAVLFLGGLWLIAAPFAVGYQPLGGGWVTATRNDLWVGALVSGISFAGLVVYAADALRELAARGRHARGREAESVTD